MIGTKKVAPNMAAMCWVPIPIVRGQLSRSLGPTTSPDATDLPSPCSVQIAILFLPDWLLVSNLEFGGHFAMPTRAYSKAKSFTYFTFTTLVTLRACQVALPVAVIRIEQLPFLDAVTNQPVCEETVFLPTFFLTTILVALQAPLELITSGRPALVFMVNLMDFFTFKELGTLGGVCARNKTIGFTGTGITTGGGVSSGVGVAEGVGVGLAVDGEGEGVGDDQLSTVNPGSVSSQRPFAVSFDEFRLISIGLILKL
jgi:hypothetical protein